MATKYNYQSIRSKISEVRILEISTGQRQDPINLSFIKVILDGGSTSNFEAISYMWGDPQGQVNVQLSGCDFHVSTRLHELLLDIRDSEEPCFVWIDAICINQEDTIERNEQVQLMKKIYHSAQAVRVWLDLDVDPNTPVFVNLAALNSESTHMDLGLQPDFWDPICTIFHNEYWGRIWIQQEVTNARELKIQCRTVLLKTSCLFHFLRLLHATQYENVMGSRWWDWAVKKPSVQLPERFGLHNSRTMPVRGSTLDTDDLDIVQTLRNAIKLNCTDDRDRVYGIMFLAHNWHEGDITVDYALSVSEVYTEASKAILHKHGSLGFLSYATLDYHGYDKITDRTPSWVPDWRRKPPNIQFAPHQRFGDCNSSYSIPGTILDHLLYTRGIKLDEISHCYQNLFHTDILSLTVLEFLEICNIIVADAISLFPLTSTESNHPGKETYSETPQWKALIRTISGSDYRRDEHPDIDNILYQSALNLVNLSQSQDRDFDPSSYKLGRLLDLSEGPFIASRLLVSFSWWMMISHYPILTSKGKIGLAPKCTKPGDEIWFVPSCEKPLILRQHEMEYLLVGETYLDGANNWQPLGGPQSTLQEGGVIGEYKVESICLK
jgi:Heterokaryon incompatibility protein (HET)